MSTNISIAGLCSPGCELWGLLWFYSNVRFAAPTQWPGMWPMLQCEMGQTGDHRPVIALIIWGQVTHTRVRAGDTSPIITEYHNSPNDSLLTAKFYVLYGFIISDYHNFLQMILFQSAIKQDDKWMFKLNQCESNVSAGCSLFLLLFIITHWVPNCFLNHIWLTSKIFWNCNDWI